MHNIKARIVGIAAAASLLTGGVAVAAPASAEAFALTFRLNKESTTPVTVYDRMYCRGDSDVVRPGEWENASKVNGVASVWIGSKAGFKVAGVPLKLKGSRAKCVNLPGLQAVVIAQTY